MRPKNTRLWERFALVSHPDAATLHRWYDSRAAETAAMNPRVTPGRLPVRIRVCGRRCSCPAVRDHGWNIKRPRESLLSMLRPLPRRTPQCSPSTTRSAIRWPERSGPSAWALRIRAAAPRTDRDPHARKRIFSHDRAGGYLWRFGAYDTQPRDMHVLAIS